MAAIIARNGRFLVRVRRRGFQPVSKTFTLRKDAVAFGRRVEADMEAGRWVEDGQRPPSLRQAVRDYRATVAPAFKGADTYRYRFDEFERLSFAAKTVDAVTPADLAEWRDDQTARHKPATVVRKLAMLSAIFSWCIKERGWLKANPVSFVRKPRVNDARTRTLSDEEVVYLMAAALTSKALWLAPALTVLMHSAMRRGELWSIRRGDVDYGAAVVHLTDTKNGSARDVPLCPRSLDAFRQLEADAEERGSTSLFPCEAVGSVSTRFVQTVRRARAMYEADCVEAGQAIDSALLTDLRLHDLRHHAVSSWASSGALSLVDLMAVSGHKTPRMLARYTHIKASALASRLAELSV